MRYHFTVLILSFFCSFSAVGGSVSPDYATLKSVYDKYKTNYNGKPASYIPELAKANSDLFAISVVTVDGKVISIGDKHANFSLQSISKIFAYALALQDNGEKIIFNKIGLEATGEQFNSIKSIENNQSHNPFVNVGAIQTTSFIRGKDSEEKWNRLVTFIKQLGGEQIFLGKRIYHSEAISNQRNRAISHLLESYGMLIGDPKEVLDRYTKACALMVNTETLASIGSTFANNGINPKTHQKVLSSKYVRDVLSEMVINGIYERSGGWFVTIGVPAKSGVSGGIIAVIPNKMAIAVYSPNLDKTGTSIRGEAVLKELSRLWNLHLISNNKLEIKGD
ncbi:glutaminase A [Legionella anisa]|uniref:Glutaminase n=5 Tax=Legionella anisa TaxID=28082 RepID=A0AAX0WSE8_9GAMM|nr:glutaminase A [Legionella anisa]AWN74668.1 glutaminase A [Legionella anisa]KTC70130.1 glutaminase [Legionella anisa]MBN5937563.1 glutaminase A [Legionella anisa]MCW8426919.1 glutaminase A [Legionella anisa]MCW8449364.1 glutaminase A [Legionella anisa]